MNLIKKVNEMEEMNAGKTEVLNEAQSAQVFGGHWFEDDEEFVKQTNSIVRH